MRKFCHILLKLMGYTIDTVNIPQEIKKCVLVFAPHTSLSDFLIGWMALKEMGVKTTFVMKKEAFFFPVKYIFKAMGAIPIDRQHGAHFPEFAANLINTRKKSLFSFRRKEHEKGWKNGKGDSTKQPNWPTFHWF